MKDVLKLAAFWLAVFVVCAFVAVFSYLWMIVAALAGSKRGWQIAVGFDQLFNVATGGCEDETISSRAYKAALRGEVWGLWVNGFLEKLDPGHGAKYVEKNVGKPMP